MVNGLIIMAEPKTLKEFLQQEIHNRDVSVRDFAELVGVSHPTVLKFLESDDVKPTLEFLVKLSKATNTNAITLAVMAYPEMSSDLAALTGRSNDVLFRSERIEQLPPNVREAIDTIIFQQTKFRKTDDDV